METDDRAVRMNMQLGPKYRTALLDHLYSSGQCIMTSNINGICGNARNGLSDSIKWRQDDNKRVT